MVDRHPQVGRRQDFDGQVGWFIVRKERRAMLARLAFALKICRQLPWLVFRTPSLLSLLERQHIFTNCLLTKMLEYGAGRELSLGDQRIVKQLVASTPQDGYRFQELIVAAVCSDVFLMK